MCLPYRRVTRGSNVTSEEPGRSETGNCDTCCFEWEQASHAISGNGTRSNSGARDPPGQAGWVACTGGVYFEPNRRTIPAEYRRLFSVWFTWLMGSGV
jgi:hypothetical protein